ncbi:dihydrofolate reductase [Motiliproteus coralliicola]|uniref:Dihydrofolate reductase n=1 Tax=Motiliproteus coralliicola TaxID=2283196 RepID=A0A369WFB8_9GAMM|nr:dihydrofolate reductase [Motiliproteus coralliicola]RDE18165.1 dihydrofolate reductase [Motiliproteus coralliicola]
MQLALIVAQSDNRVIGRNNALPWHLPEDLKYFKSVTMGKVIIMGRKTYESIGRPLPGRTNLVVSRDPEYRADGITVVNSLEQAIEQAQAVSEINGADEALIIGGANLYEQALPQVQRLYLTQVHHQIHGDAHFPELVMDQWQQQSRQDFAAVEPNPYDYSFIVLERKA